MQYTEIFKVVKNCRKILIFFLFAFKTLIVCTLVRTGSARRGYKLELALLGGSNVYPQYMFWSKSKKNKHNPVLLYK